MIITVIDAMGKVTPVEVDEGTAIEDLKALIEVEMNIPFVDQILVFENKRLDDKKTLKESGIKDGDMIRAENKKALDLMKAFQNPNQNPFNMFNQGGNQANNLNNQLKQEALKIKKHYEESPNDLQYILHQSPEFAQAVLNDDINVLMNYIKKSNEKKNQEKMKEMERITKLNADPFDLENQKAIEEEIRMGNVNDHLEMAQEYMPESFGSVTMLYIDTKINGTQIQAFVDSGAQITIMSQVCAERCGIFRFIDKRFSGMAQGVGTSRILGRVHIVAMQVMGEFFQCSITILEDDKVDFLFGLDMLKRHQCNIDLKSNKLVFTATDLHVPFLAEGEIKRHLITGHPKDDKLMVNEDKKDTNPSNQGTIPKPQLTQPKNTSGYAEDEIAKLTSLGFSKEQAIEALKACGGNTELAASFLFQGGGF
jgi:DNA damage-inducible protein 1